MNAGAGFSLKGNMPVVLFIYGLCFLVMGFACYVSKRKESRLSFAGDLWLLSYFGIIHGVHEWIEILLLGYSYSGEKALIIPSVANLILLAASYFFLFQFGVELVRYFYSWQYLRLLPAIFTLLLLVSTPFITAHCQTTVFT